MTLFVYRLICTACMHPTAIYEFKTNNGNNRTYCEIYSKLIKNTLCCRFGLSIVNFDQISYINLVFPLLTLNKQMPAGYATNLLVIKTKTWLT